MLTLLCLQGCYYTHIARGHLDLVNKSVPIEEIIANPDTPDDLVRKLRLVQEARLFAVEHLYLPDNGSYLEYSDIGREYVVWNVFATPEFSLEPKVWCFPVSGCVSYRGYFQKDLAKRKGRDLATLGYDVAIGGAAAYSTLGKFSDPVVSTMMRWDDTQLVAVLFHELAHQKLYVKGDSAFNESFATAVEEFGVARWLEAQGNEDALQEYWQRRKTRQHLMKLVSDARVELQSFYEETLDPDEKRLLKEDRLDLLKEQAAKLMAETGGDPTYWMNVRLNNARLVSMTLYEGKLPEFRALLAECEQNIQCFYDKAGRLAAR